MRAFLILVALAGLAACSRPPAPPAAVADAPAPAPAASPDRGEQGGTDDWRKVASAADADKLARLDQAWSAALAEAKLADAAQLAAAGPVLAQDAALSGRPMPSPGDYRCRTYKLGRQGETGPAFAAYPYFPCRVTLSPGGDLALERTGGSQRVRGLIYPDSDKRTVFVGAQALAGETAPPAYGADSARNQLGVIERIGDTSWRLVVPWPAAESKLDVTQIAR